jgi:hypothetical protein
MCSDAAVSLYAMPIRICRTNKMSSNDVEQVLMVVSRKLRRDMAVDNHSGGAAC